jgi:dethiobiotin synthetase
MNGPILYVTGTNTGVGKTMLVTLLLRRARARAIRIAALKPFCSGGREDAEQIHALQDFGLTLDEVNPFYFSAPVTPLLAARKEGRSVDLNSTLAAIDKVAAKNLPLIIEGAGGLLSPLGEGFSLMEIIQRRPGKICIVGINSLGVLNHVLLTSRAVHAFEQAVVLMNAKTPDEASEENPAMLRSVLPSTPIAEIPRLDSHKISPQLESSLDQILNWATGNPPA